jgi:hypothetical protein
LKWLKAVQIFFAAKGVTHNEDQIRVVGSLIRETNTITWYKNGSDKLTQLVWLDFRAKLIKFVLPPLRHTTLRHRLHDLSMRDLESFASFSTRARTLQSRLNFEQHTTTNFAIAEAVMFGLPQEVKALVNNFRLLRANLFDYSKLKSNVQGYFDNLPKRTTTRSRAPASQLSSSSPSKPCQSRKEVVWRIHAYLDSQGRCHFCKKTCGSSPGTCKGPLDQTYVKIPNSFKAPPKPSNYKPSKAHGPASTGAGKPTQAPAGRPGGQEASVAAIKEEPFSPTLTKPRWLLLLPLMRSSSWLKMRGTWSHPL